MNLDAQSKQCPQVDGRLVRASEGRQLAEAQQGLRVGVPCGMLSIVLQVSDQQQNVLSTQESGHSPQR